MIDPFTGRKVQFVLYPDQFAKIVSGQHSGWFSFRVSDFPASGLLWAGLYDAARDEFRAGKHPRDEFEEADKKLIRAGAAQILQSVERFQRAG